MDWEEQRPVGHHQSVVLLQCPGGRKKRGGIAALSYSQQYQVKIGYRALALPAQTTGRLHKAADPFEDALAFCAKAGYQPGLVRTCCD